MSNCRPKNTDKPELRPEKANPAISRAELEVLRQKIVDLTAQKPDKAAVILSDWINRAITRKKTG